MSISTVSAHLIGQPPFLKINDQYANLYPVPVSSLYNFDLPQDLSPENYLVNTPINFELDKDKLPAPADIIAKTKFDWDFTDGTHGQGLKLQHKFISNGSYIVKIYADDGTTSKPQMLESVLINILPNINYQLPRAKILINGKESKDPLTDILQIDFTNEISFDGSKSNSANSIIEYFWDFGDQKSAKGINQTHNYPKDLSQVFVVLRIKDKNGFIADNFAEIQNSQNEQNNMATPPAGTPTPSAKKTNQLPFTLAGIAILGAIIFIVRWWLLGRYRGKHQ